VRILLYVPDNSITHGYMPTLWPHLLKALTPPQHSVITVDGNVVQLAPDHLAQYVIREKVDLVGIGGMTRTIHRSYAVADRLRAQGVPVVLGGPHVSAEPEEGLEHADAVVCGEADDLWPSLLADFENGGMKPIYRAMEKPDLTNYPLIPWQETDFKQFTMLPRWLAWILQVAGYERLDINVTPMETGRGCPYRCDFCSVSPFFGEKVRFRPKENVIAELKLLERLGRRFVFFVDDNFAINPAHTKSLLQAMIDAGVRIRWAAQISMNLLRDQELLDLMQRSGCIGAYIGLESVLPESLAEVNKGFNKPAQYAQILADLYGRGIYTVTSFIFGIDTDRPGISQRTWEVISGWSPGLFPIFSQLTPLPGTPLYKKLLAENRLEHRHWMNYRPYGAVFEPKLMTRQELEQEIAESWRLGYAPRNIYQRLRQMRGRSRVHRFIYLCATLVLRGVYFRQMTLTAWLSTLWQNRRALLEILRRREAAPLPSQPPQQAAAGGGRCTGKR